MTAVIRHGSFSEDLAGWLYQQSFENHKSWKHKYFVLKRRDGLLLVFKNEQESKPQRLYDLKLCEAVEAETSEEIGAPKSRHIRLRLRTPHQNLVLCAEKDEDHRSWLEHLEAARAASRLSKTGYLLKQGAVVKNWKRRWFVLKDRQLLYYKTEEDANISEVQGVINLSECTFVGQADEKAGRPNSFAIETNDRTFLLIADSPDERDEWIIVLTFHPEYPFQTRERTAS